MSSDLALASSCISDEKSRSTCSTWLNDRNRCSARARLGRLANRATFIERSFKEKDWPVGLGAFGCVVTNQAVHELRHKRYAAQLHVQVRTLLNPGGVYLVCDHFASEGGMKDESLYMSIAEQVDALQFAGFSSVRQVMAKGGLVLHHAA